MLHVIHRGQATHVERKGEDRWYYLANDLELIRTHLPPRFIQDVHGHSKITEVTYVLAGMICVELFHPDGRLEAAHEFLPGDVFAIPPDGQMHRMWNPGTATAAETLTIKFVSRADCQDLFRFDKMYPPGVAAPIPHGRQQRPTFGATK